MNNRITQPVDEPREIEGEDHRGPQPIGEILQDLLAQYERRFPGVRIAVVETPANAI